MWRHAPGDIQKFVYALDVKIVAQFPEISWRLAPRAEAKSRERRGTNLLDKNTRPVYTTTAIS